VACHKRRWRSAQEKSGLPVTTDVRQISSFLGARIALVPFWPNMEARGSEASSRAGLLLVGYLASRCCANHSVAGPAEASKSFT
jgi:hypothetical protein